MGKRRSLKPHEPFNASDDDEDDEYEEVKEKEPLSAEQISQIQSRPKLTAKRRVTQNNTPNPFAGFGGFSGFKAQTEQTQQNGVDLNKDEIKTQTIQTSIQTNTDSSDTINSNEREEKFINELSKIYGKYYDIQRDYKLPTHLIDKNETNKSNYAKLLMELNKRCVKWITKHVEESPFVYLTPIFIDYFNYLIQLEKEFFPNTFQLKSQNGTRDDVNATPMTTTIPTAINEINMKPNSSISILKSTESKTQSEIKFPSLATTEFKFTPILLTTTTTSTPMTTSKTDAQNIAPLSDDLTIKPSWQTGGLMSLTKIPLDTSTKSLFKFGSNSQSASYENNLMTKTLESQTTQITFGSSDSSNSNQNVKSITPAISNTTVSFMSTPSLVIPELKEKKQQKSEMPTFSLNFLNKPLTTLGTQSSTETPSVTTTTAATTTTTTSNNNFFSFLTNKPTDTEATKIGAASTFKPFSFGTSGSLFSSGGFLGAGQTSIFPSSSTSIFSSASSIGKLSDDVADGSGGGGGSGAADEEPYEPPKPEFEEVKEEGSLYTKRVKLYFFNTKENKYTDRGIGNLHLKPIKNGDKTQLIIRADTSLGNILLNVGLNKQIPINKVSSKDISFICVPNPSIPNLDSNAPCKFLFKVKTENDANELFDKLNEFSKK